MIPIVGRTHDVLFFQTQVLLRCLRCESGSLVFLNGSTPAQCPSCQTAFVVSRVNWDGASPIESEIAVRVVPPVTKES